MEIVFRSHVCAFYIEVDLNVHCDFKSNERLTCRFSRRLRKAFSSTLIVEASSVASMTAHHLFAADFHGQQVITWRRQWLRVDLRDLPPVGPR
jgi:hypothetical protein